MLTMLTISTDNIPIENECHNTHRAQVEKQPRAQVQPEVLADVVIVSDFFIFSRIY